MHDRCQLRALLAAREDRLGARSCSLLAKMNAFWRGTVRFTTDSPRLHAHSACMNLQRPACAWHEFSAPECMHSCYSTCCSHNGVAAEADGPRGQRIVRVSFSARKR